MIAASGFGGRAAASARIGGSQRIAGGVVFGGMRCRRDRRDGGTTRRPRGPAGSRGVALRGGAGEGAGGLDRAFMALTPRRLGPP